MIMDAKNRHPRTLNQFLQYVCERYDEKPSLGFAFKSSISYREFYDRIVSTCDLLEKEGVGHGDRVAILGENSPNWGIAYFAILQAGATAVPILPDFPDSDIRHILMDSEVRVLFTTERQIDKLGDLNGMRLKHIITLDDFETSELPLKVEPFREIVGRAVDILRRLPETVGLISKRAKPGDIASIIYTSGTSGHSKAVMLTHKNLLANVIAMTRLIDIGRDWTFLSILPLSHAYEFTVGFLFPLFSGARICYLGKPPTPSLMEKACREERPHAICSVPLILEKIYKKKVQAVLEKKTLIRMLTRVPGVRTALSRAIGKKLIAFFGGRLQVMAVGGASFNRDAESFFHQARFPYLVGYGLTETSPLLSGGPFGDRSIAVSSAGKPVPGVEIRIDQPDPDSGIGEICARGENVMAGYYNNAELTREVIDDEGWFRTGDLGRFDDIGNLHITGRSKNVIVLSHGENIFPEIIEEQINNHIYVLESLVVERNDSLEAWVYPDYDLIDLETRGKTENQRRKRIDEVLAAIRSDVNASLPLYARLTKICERTEPFEKTATQKIKRYLYSRS